MADIQASEEVLTSYPHMFTLTPPSISLSISFCYSVYANLLQSSNPKFKKDEECFVAETGSMTPPKTELSLRFFCFVLFCFLFLRLDTNKNENIHEGICQMDRIEPTMCLLSHSIWQKVEGWHQSRLGLVAYCWWVGTFGSRIRCYSLFFFFFR